MADNSSATGGYLQDLRPHLSQKELMRFFHGFLAGLTGLPKSHVRPAFQKNAPPLLENGVDWLSYYLTDFDVENGSAYLKKGDLSRHETFSLKCVFYGDECLNFACALRDCLELAQNREELFKNGLAFFDADVIIFAPEIVNGEHYPRADLSLRFCRELKRAYNIFDFEKAQGNFKDFKNVGFFVER